MKTTVSGIVLGATLIASFPSAQASLIDVGGGLIYDDALHITWLKNANLAATRTFGVSGITADGRMTWNTALSWINAMNAANYLGYNTWRLPTLSPIDGSNTFNYPPIHDGSHDRGYNISEAGTLYAGSTAHEMAHLFYDTLGNDALCAPSTESTDAGCHKRATPDYYGPWGLTNRGPFTGLVNYRYWYKLESGINTARAFDFNFNDGQTGTGAKTGLFQAWAVLPGQAAVVPVPAAGWLFGSGILGLVAVGRRRAR